MNCTASDLVPRRLPVQWLDAPATGPLAICRRHRRCARGALPRGAISRLRLTARPGGGVRRGGRGFTLLEMMMVITIIGLIAAMTLPHVSGFSKAYSMSTATRQLLDDVALARQRAMVNRSTVYMVFLPPTFWTSNYYSNPPAFYQVPSGQQVSNLMMHQYGAYALVSLGAVGDQPGVHYPRYLTDWRALPSGVFVAPFEFTLHNNVGTNILTTNTLTSTIITNQVSGWNYMSLPFPSIFQPHTAMLMPCIGFTAQGALTTNVNQYIALARGSIFYPTDTNGNPLFQPPNWVENPPGNDVANPNLIQIDWLTARPTLVQNQFQ